MERLDIAHEMHDRILFIIRNHLEMVRYANKFDLEDPEVIDAFANFVEGEQRLRFLYVHTFCDANATAPDLWNAHKEELHTQLFNNTLSVLEGKRARKDPSILKDAFKNLSIEGISQEELVQHLDLVPVRYFSHAGKEDVSRHVEMVSRYKQNKHSTSPEISWRNDLRRSLTIVDIVTKDREAYSKRLPGHFPSLNSIFLVQGQSRKDGLAIDVFYVENEEGGVVDNQKTRETCEAAMKSFLADESSPEEKITAKRKKFDLNRPFSNEEKLGEKIPPRVDVYKDLSLNRTIVEVRAADQIGLLHLIAKTISSCGLSIQFARIATEQGIATDIFNVEPKDSNQAFTPSQFLDLREKLSTSLNQAKYYHEV